jgi:release factor glutamine methyltransferase
MSEAVTVGGLLAAARTRLAGDGTARLDAEVLLCHVLECSRAWLFAHGDDPVGDGLRGRFDALIERRAQGEPVAYLVGRREFWSLPFEVSPDVLIPRPETELLVETALELLPRETPARVADLGTGCAAVAIVLAVERPLCEVHATDISEAALEVARRNADRLAPGRVAFHRGSWLDPLEGRFDVIVSNPPYIDRDDEHLRRGDCRFEPRVALTPGANGMAAIEHIAGGAGERLRSGGCLAFEHGFEQGGASREVLKREGFVRVETRKDLAGRERVTLGFRP